MRPIKKTARPQSRHSERNILDCRQMIETNGKDGRLDSLLNSLNFWLNLFSDAVQPSDKIDGWFGRRPNRQR